MQTRGTKGMANSTSTMMRAILIARGRGSRFMVVPLGAGRWGGGALSYITLIRGVPVLLRVGGLPIDKRAALANHRALP